jgi:cysteine synthase A|uniref:Tryptophan synthase beta chain-like PALP domain-containing protein n=1 Tax=Eutreptiella gymnastica TaxID=73025 RepID=A0A7S4CX46_9EUGL|eukprot:CAMPEP_0174285636 /NCGR_PEP_ID=MMETSP0809-20121228/9139_1 /TAXON_ID=73025 ORGANISM="Eutreptiella gymnastica-like, Strain CCMP1594" /NCGR_SAMPLE_ID=MMETSP0809 /ASSEMBLY_ACC=CAM_ASM_000658 /LENGTH=351 /DNA_ID=CAMNT_0015381457 /DNA_START=26 /DNA_END=1081 /DNA_ORIENTATION=+
MSYAENVIDLIGNTPMVKLNRVTEGTKAGKVLVKLEMQNPGGSVKDRIAKSMIEQAEADGLITPGKTTVVEYTSGNTGIGLAMVCAAKGYDCVIVMPQLPPMKERYMICRKFGAQVHLTAGKLGIPGMKTYVDEQLQKNPDWWCPRQFENPANPAVHTATTAPEIWKQTGGDIDYLVAGAGTGGTVSAVAQFLKEKKPDIKVVCVEPTESRVLVGNPHAPHTIVGIGAGVPLKFVKELAPDQEWGEGPRGVIDEFQHCASPDAIAFADKMAKKEGLLVGPSTGAAIKVAMDIANRPEAEGKTICVISASSGIRYVAHPLWNPERSEGTEALPAPPNMDPEPLLRWTSSKAE